MQNLTSTSQDYKFLLFPTLFGIVSLIRGILFFDTNGAYVFLFSASCFLLSALCFYPLATKLCKRTLSRKPIKIITASILLVSIAPLLTDILPHLKWLEPYWTVLAIVLPLIIIPLAIILILNREFPSDAIAFFAAILFLFRALIVLTLPTFYIDIPAICYSLAMIAIASLLISKKHLRFIPIPLGVFCLYNIAILVCTKFQVYRVTDLLASLVLLALSLFIFVPKLQKFKFITHYAWMLPFFLFQMFSKPNVPTIMPEVIAVAFLSYWFIVLDSSNLEQPNATFDFLKSTFKKIKKPTPLKGADAILFYKQQLDNGEITQEEFDAKKKEILGI